MELIERSTMSEESKVTLVKEDKSLHHLPENIVNEVVPVDQPLPQTNDPDLPVVPPTQVNIKRTGYEIYMEQSGKVIFNFFGNKATILEVVGLHEVASKKIFRELEIQLGTGASVTVEQLAILSNKLDSLHLLVAGKPTR
jgi:hypothetical protein